MWTNPSEPALPLPVRHGRTASRAGHRRWCACLLLIVGVLAVYIVLFICLAMATVGRPADVAATSPNGVLMARVTAALLGAERLTITKNPTGQTWVVWQDDGDEAWLDPDLWIERRRIVWDPDSCGFVYARKYYNSSNEIVVRFRVLRVPPFARWVPGSFEPGAEVEPGRRPTPGCP